jgi:hypothetical protein
VFYNYWPSSTFRPTWNCGTYKRRAPLLGCAIGFGPSVRDLVNEGKVTLKDMSGLMYPWSCLVCCTQGVQGAVGDIVDSARAFTNYVLIERGQADWPVVEASQTPWPSYVKKIVEGETLSDEDWEKAGVGQVTVFRRN